MILKKQITLFTFLLLAFFISAQSTEPRRKISGIITDEKGESIIGANILVKNTKLGTISDTNGHFSIEAPVSGTIVVSYIGYMNKTIEISGKENFNITLKEDSKGLDEVVVIGYGSMKKQNLTSSVSKITNEAILERPIATLGEALAGNLAGVRAQATGGTPGQELQIRIRGVNTINGSSDPLYIIDGVPFEDMSDLNPSDVASVQILKDASATSIYGARGANGVVLIETKQGTGSPSVTFDAFYGLQDPEKYVSMMTSKEWLAYNIWKRNNDYLRSGGSMSDSMSSRPDADKIPDSWLDPNLTTTDWQKAITQMGPIQSYQMSASSKSKLGTMFFSGGYFDQQGIIRETYYNRINFRFNGTLNVSKNIKVGVNVAPSLSNQDAKDAEGKETVIHHALLEPPLVKLNEATRDWGFPNLGITVYPNPLERLKETIDKTTINKLTTSAWAEISFSKNLVFKSQYSYNYDGRVHEYFVPGNVTYNNNNVTIGNAYSIANNGWSLQNTLTYDFKKNNHSLNLMLGQSADAANNFRMDAAATGWPLENISTLNVATLPTDASTERYQIRTASFFGRAIYNYKEKYLFNASLRNDGSSRFGSSNRWGLFPSFSGGWKLNEESFLKSVDWLSLLKIRTSWGTSGNDRIGYYDYLSIMTTDNSAYGNSVQGGLAPKNIQNSNLKWESTASLNFGLDFSAFKNRLQFNFDYYINTTQNLLFNLPIPLTSGFETIRTNLGSVENRGWEFDITSRNTTGAFSWTTSLNLSGNSNKVLDMGGIESFTSAMWDGKFITRVGGPVSQFYVYRTDGILSANDFEKKADGITPDENKPLVAVYSGERIGHIKFVDQPTKLVDGKLVGDGVISESDLVPYGNNIPDVIYGLTNRFSYKGFDLSVLVQGQLGGDVMYLGQRAFDTGAVGVNQFSHWLRCWKPDYQAVYGDRGDPTPYNLGVDMSWDGKTPNIYSRNTTYDNNSDLRIYDTSYLRIKNITLSYNFPKNLLKSTFLKNAKVYVSIDNLATFDNYPGVSPETNSYGNSTTMAGVDYSTYPTSKKYTLGFNFVF